MAEDTYFFINKTIKSSSLSHSEPKERRSVGAHIQSRRRLTTKHQTHPEKNNDLKPDLTELASVKNDEHSYESEMSCSDMPPHGQKNAMPHVCNAIQSMREFANPAASTCRIEWLWDSVAYSPPGSFYDRYVQVDPLVHDLLEYFVMSYEPSIRYLENIFEIKDSPNFRAQPSMLCVGDILSNQMETDALVAAMSARIQDMEGFDQRGRDLIYANRAIASVSKFLGKPLIHPARMFRTIYFLAIVAWHHQDKEALTSHLCALKSIVESAGGVQKLHPTVRVVLMRFDGTISAERFVRPEFASTYFAPSSADVSFFEIALPKLSASSRVGWRFKNGEYVDVCGLTFHRLILDLVRCVSIIDLQFKLSNASARLFGLAIDRIDLARHQLLEYETRNVVEKLLRVSILIWMLMVFTNEGRKDSMKIMMSSFRDYYEGIQRSYWKNRAALHAWILSIGVMAAESDSVNELYLMSELKEALRETGINVSDSESLIKFLESFLHSRQAQGLALSKFSAYGV